MRWEDVCAAPATVVGEHGRTDFRKNGFLVLPALLSNEQLEPLRAGLCDLVEQSRSITESTHLLDLENGHTADSPRLRRAADIDDTHAAFWELCSESVLVDVAADVLGPNVRFREAYANMKWAGGGASVKWHQDLAFYPHTNSSTIQFVVALEDMTTEQGPPLMIPGSHRGPLYSHYDDSGDWLGAIDPSRLGHLDLDDAVEVTGPAGTVSMHHGLTLHGSATNHSDRGRPVLIITFAAADAIAYTAPPYRSSHHGHLVRGVETGIAHHEEMTLILPPDWSGGYTSLFAHQHDRETT